MTKQFSAMKAGKNPTNHNHGRSDTIFLLLDLRHQSVGSKGRSTRERDSIKGERDERDRPGNKYQSLLIKQRTLNKWCWKDAKVGWIKRTRKRRDAFGRKPVCGDEEDVHSTVALTCWNCGLTVSHAFGCRSRKPRFIKAVGRSSPSLRYRLPCGYVF